mmetsp:Transcript_3592/g.5427  ORF Transcript_3592/g.5427 Transcript_3592/m.5427 type:complete len:261 (-) Transcript_3592:930-1712(-)
MEVHLTSGHLLEAVVFSLVIVASRLNSLEVEVRCPVSIGDEGLLGLQASQAALAHQLIFAFLLELAAALLEVRSCLRTAIRILIHLGRVGSGTFDLHLIALVTVVLRIEDRTALVGLPLGEVICCQSGGASPGLASLKLALFAHLVHVLDALVPQLHEASDAVRLVGCALAEVGESVVDGLVDLFDRDFHLIVHELFNHWLLFFFLLLLLLMSRPLLLQGLLLGECVYVGLQTRYQVICGLLLLALSRSWLLLLHEARNT